MTSLSKEIIDRTPEGSSSSFSDPNLSYSGILTDDYTHSKFLTLSYQGKGKNFVLKSKGTVDLQGTHFSHPKPKTSSQVKIITNINGRDVEAKFDNKGVIRLWANLGTFNLIKPTNVITKFKTDSTFSRFSYSTNFDIAYSNLDISTRLHCKNGSHLFFNQKLLYKEKSLQFGAIYKLSLATFLFSKINIFGQYKYGDYKFFFEHGLNGNGITRFASFGKTVLAGLYKTKKYKCVVKSTFNHGDKANLFTCNLGAISKIDDKTTLRAKINNKGKFAVSGKYEMNKNLTLLAGSQVNLLEPSSFSTSKVVPVPLGLTLKFSYK